MRATKAYDRHGSLRSLLPQLILKLHIIAFNVFFLFFLLCQKIIKEISRASCEGEKEMPIKQQIC